MYYGYDNNVKLQYALYTQVGDATPYITELNYVSDMDGVYRRIEEIEKRHNHYRQRFYIDNDFYNNKFDISTGGTYYKFLTRRVLEWEPLELLAKNQKESDNVIYMFRA